MSINLQKGQKIDLSKTNPTVKKFTLGLGWDVRETVGETFDLDVSAFVLGSTEKLISDQHFVFYNNKVSPNDFLTHNGDNTSGVGDGDDETLLLDISKATDEQRVVFVVTIHEAQAKGQNFGQVKNAYIRVCDESGTELMKFDLSEDFSIETAIEFGAVYLNNGEWKFQAIGTGFAGGLQEFINKYSN